MPKSREVHLVARPDGLPAEQDFELVETDVPDAADGEVLVENLYMSVDPAMRPRLTVGYELNEPLEGGAVGRVVQSRAPGFDVGDLVTSRLGFREYFVSGPGGISKLEVADGLPLTVHLHALGGTGFTAYGGLLKIARLKPEDKVFVSTAAGAVGSVAAQIARIKGCWVVGSTGSAEKARWLAEDAGLSAVIDYKATPIRRALHQAAPEGIDVYFDNVGGDHLDAALACMNTLGRVAVCGMISGYNEPGARTVVRNLANIIYGRITLRGFTGADFPELHDDFVTDMTGWLREGRIQYRETILEGIDAAPRALIGLLEGLNAGKMLVKLQD
jgi:NADPH-dependent curcumin reductase CurA